MNPWKILGVNRQMTDEEIHSAYISLAKKYHPDTNKGDIQKFKVIVGAYTLLKNPAETRKFITQMNAVGKDCKDCKGKGATFKQRSFTGRDATTCRTCEGSGIIIKEKQK